MLGFRRYKNQMTEITTRPLELLDIPLLQRALDQDQFEHATVPQYTMDGAFSEVYEDKDGPIGILRYTKTLRLVCVWCDNKDLKRNAVGAAKAVRDAITKAKTNGYTDIIFETESPTLQKFMEAQGFTQAGNTMYMPVGK